MAAAANMGQAASIPITSGVYSNVDLGNFFDNMDEAALQELGYERYELVGNSLDNSGHNISKRSPINPFSIVAKPTLKTLGTKVTTLGVSLLPTVFGAPGGALFIKGGKLFKTGGALSVLPPPIGK